MDLWVLLYLECNILMYISNSFKMILFWESKVLDNCSSQPIQPVYLIILQLDNQTLSYYFHSFYTFNFIFLWQLNIELYTKMRQIKT